jgi:hypothetical protein
MALAVDVIRGHDDEVMSLPASPPAAVSPAERVEALFEESAELAGQRNAIDGRIVQIVAEMERDELCGATGARWVVALVRGRSARPRQTPSEPRPPKSDQRQIVRARTADGINGNRLIESGEPAAVGGREGQ